MILHADADAFFVSVARLVDPEGAGRAKLLLVGGTASGRGVVCSASYETRAFGVRSAMPMSRALRLCPDAMCVPVPSECGRMSRAIRRVLDRWTPLVEGASVDEWYLDMSGTEQLYNNEPLTDTAHRIRDDVFRETSLRISIGGGPTKIVAKLAAERAKPRVDRPGATGVLIVAPSDVRTFLAGLQLADIPGVGPKAQAKFASLALNTIGDALALDLESLQTHFGPRGGAWLYARMRGSDERVVTPHEPRKQMSHERTFSKDIADTATLRNKLDGIARLVAADLRKEGLHARTVTVKLRDGDFKTRSATQSLRAPAESDHAIVTVARALFDKLRKSRRVPARLIGVAVGGFDERAPRSQLSLFAAPPADGAVETEKDRQLSRAVDKVRAKFGGTSLTVGERKRGS